VLSVLWWSGSSQKGQLVEGQLVDLLLLVAFGRLYTIWSTQIMHYSAILYIVDQMPLVVISRPSATSAKL
jgi:hypothetical protein